MPPLFRSVGQTFKVGLAGQGELQSAFYFGTLMVGIVGGVLLERFGTKIVTGIAILLLSMGISLMGLAPTHDVVIAGGTLIGMGNGWMAVIYSAAVARRFEEQRQKIFTWAMLFLAAGGTLGPYAVSLFIVRSTTWRTPLVTFGALLAVGGVIFSLMHMPVLDILETNQKRHQRSQTTILRKARLWWTTTLTLLHGFAASILVAWVGRLYQERLSVSDERAALLLSVNAGGFFAGRLLLATFFAGKLPDRVLLGLCAGAGTVTYVMVNLNHNYVLAIALMFFFGTIMSGDAPSIYSFAAKQFSADAEVAFAVLQGVGAVGATVGPWMIGELGEHFGLDKAIWVGPAFLFSLSAISFSWEITDRAQARRAHLPRSCSH